MTRASKKAQERFFAEEAAKRMGKVWIVGSDQEEPDFLVDEGETRFGLEVCEVFMGPQSLDGSVLKRAESITQQKVNSLRHEYEASSNIPLTVKLVGNVSAANLATVVPALLSKNLASKPICHQLVIDEGCGLRIHVTKALRPDWYSVNDRVGWVDRNPTKQISVAIEKKSKALMKYRENTGSDIRLLLVANRFHNSGKLTLEGGAAFDLHGFQCVYFFSFPEQVMILKSGPRHH